MSPDPLSEAALQLIENLKAAHEYFRDADAHSRMGAIFALNSVIEFLLRFEVVNEENLAAPLLAVSLALNDADDGIPSPIIEVSRKVGRKRESSTRKAVRAYAALTLDLLMKSGLPLKEAAEKVADCLMRSGVTRHSGGGLMITGDTVIGWRNNISADYGKGFTAEMYEEERERLAFGDAALADIRNDLLRRLDHLLTEYRAGDEKPIKYPK